MGPKKLFILAVFLGLAPNALRAGSPKRPCPNLRGTYDCGPAHLGRYAGPITIAQDGLQIEIESGENFFGKFTADGIARTIQLERLTLWDKASCVDGKQILLEQRYRAIANGNEQVGNTQSRLELNDARDLVIQNHFQKKVNGRIESDRQVTDICARR